LNYGERNQYSEGAHVECAAEKEGARPIRPTTIGVCLIRSQPQASQERRGSAGDRGDAFHSDWG